MQIRLQGHGMIVSKRLSDHVENRIGRLDRMLPGIEELRVEFKRNSSKVLPPRTVQITIRRKRTILRAEEQNSDPLKAFDEALAALEQRVERYKTRRVEFDHAEAGEILADALAAEIVAVPAEPARVLRIKTFSNVPMSIAEAIEQMELLGHSFFAFVSDENAAVNVVYSRIDGGYGLLQPEK